jgi:hypothetical protein
MVYVRLKVRFGGLPGATGLTKRHDCAIPGGVICLGLATHAMQLLVFCNYAHVALGNVTGRR